MPGEEVTVTVFDAEKTANDLTRETVQQGRRLGPAEQRGRVLLLARRQVSVELCDRDATPLGMSIHPDGHGNNQTRIEGSAFAAERARVHRDTTHGVLTDDQLLLRNLGHKGERLPEPPRDLAVTCLPTHAGGPPCHDEARYLDEDRLSPAACPTRACDWTADADAERHDKNEGYSGHSVEMQADYSGDSCFECSDGAPVIGVHDPPGLEVRDYLLDHPADLIDLRVEFLLPVQQLAARGLLEGRDHPVPDEALVAGPVKRVSVQENL